VAVARNGDAGAEQLALVQRILQRDTRGNRFQALEPGGRFKVGALFAAVKGHRAFRTIPFEVRTRGQHRCAVVATRRRDALYQAGEARTRGVLHGPGPLR
jgi:hypothetical protein